MKTNFTQLALAIAVSVLAGNALAADPYVDSWLTTSSGKYARIYTTDANKTNGVSVTTWSNGTQNQALPAYAGVQEIYSSASWVYIRSTGLGIHTMGPWQNGAFPNMPINTKTFYRIPRTNSVPVTKTLTGLGAIGYFVDGVAMFDSRDAFYWNGSTDNNQGAGYWNRDAYVNEGATFDPGYAHQPQDGSHHYHASPIALRYELSDHVNFNPTNKMYSESTGAVTTHSPLLGWVRDGFPIYGPYGYSSAANSASGVRRMISGYVVRNGQSGTQNLTATGRTGIPAWAQRLYNVASNILSGPAVASYALGHYMEDNDYLGDLGRTQGVDFDLDENNGRFCVTPEFPGGTYAYFVSIGSNGTPTFPYNIGRAYHGNPTGGAVTTLAETVVTNFVGGPKLSASLNKPSMNNGTVTLSWSAIEGGTYRVESSTNLTTWTTNAAGIASVLNTGSYTNASPESAKFFRVAMTALATYDPVSGTSGGGGSNFVAPGGSVSLGGGTNIIVSITLPASPPNPPANAPITGVTLAGVTGTNASYATQGTVIASFALVPGTPTSASPQNISIQFQNGPPQPYLVPFTILP